MDNKERKIIEIPEITRVEGHAAVVVDLVDGKVDSVKLDVFEGTRFFEKIVVGHKYSELPHITSRVCAICSAGHVLAAIISVEHALHLEPTALVRVLRELMHLGMIIESHSTHLFALALPDYVGAKDLVDFANNHGEQFRNWTELRKLGSTIQSTIGGRPFHPVNLQVGGLSRYPSSNELKALLPLLRQGAPLAVALTERLMSYEPGFSRQTTPVFVALEPDQESYGYFGNRVISSEGWQAPISDYKEYLGETVVSYSHAKRSTFFQKSLMVGSMARLILHNDRLRAEARNLFKSSAIAQGQTNTILNNVGQAIELVQAIDRCIELIEGHQTTVAEEMKPDIHLKPTGQTTGAIECPRGTLYHWYDFDQGTVVRADMVTPSAQNTARIERDIHEVVAQATDTSDPQLQRHLETLIRAYDPCNTCATHMVQIRHR